MKQAVMKKLDDLDWNSWQGKDPATLVFVVRDDQILLINKPSGISVTADRSGKPDILQLLKKQLSPPEPLRLVLLLPGPVVSF